MHTDRRINLELAVKRSWKASGIDLDDHLTTKAVFHRLSSIEDLLIDGYRRPYKGI
jgi:nitric oxide synthase oxygenase domain/subunit